MERNILHSKRIELVLDILQILSVIGFIIGILGIILLTAGVIN